jgi:hypothetical protein
MDRVQGVNLSQDEPCNCERDALPRGTPGIPHPPPQPGRGEKSALTAKALEMLFPEVLPYPYHNPAPLGSFGEAAGPTLLPVESGTSQGPETSELLECLG